MAKDNVKLPTQKKGTPQNMNQNIIDDELYFHAGRNRRKGKKRNSTAKGQGHHTNSQITNVNHNIQPKIQEHTTENRQQSQNHLLEENGSIRKTATISNEGNKKITGEQDRPELKESRRESHLSHQRSPEEHKKEITDKSAETNPVRPRYSVNSNVKDAQRAYEERILHKSESSISVPESKASDADKALMLSREKNETAHHEQRSKTSSTVDGRNNHFGRSGDDSGSVKKSENYTKETLADSELFHQPTENITRGTDLSVIGKSNVADAQKAYEESIKQPKESLAESDLRIVKSPEPISINTGYEPNKSYHADFYESERISDVNNSSGFVDGTKIRSEHEQDSKIRFEKPSSYKEQTEDRQYDQISKVEESKPLSISSDSKQTNREENARKDFSTGYIYNSNVKDAQRAFEESLLQKTSKDSPVSSHDCIVEYTDNQVAFEEIGSKIQESGSIDSRKQSTDYQRMVPLQPCNPLRSTEMSPNVTQELRTDVSEVKEGNYKEKLNRDFDNHDKKGVQPSYLFGNNKDAQHVFDENLFQKTKDIEQKEISVSTGFQNEENPRLDEKNTRLQESGYAEKPNPISAYSRMTSEKTSSAIEQTKEQPERVHMQMPGRSDQQSIRERPHVLESNNLQKPLPADMHRNQFMNGQRLFDDDMVQQPNGLFHEDSILTKENDHSLDGRESKLKVSGTIERLAQSDGNSIIDLKTPSKDLDNQGNMNQAFDANKRGLSENHPKFLKDTLNQELQNGSIPSAQSVITINRNIKDAQRAFQESTLNRPKFQEQVIFPVYDNENQEKISEEQNHKLSDTEQNKIFLESGETIPISSRKQDVSEIPKELVLKGGAVDETLPGERQRLFNDQNRRRLKDVSALGLHGTSQYLSEKFEKPDLQKLSYTEQPGIVQGHPSQDVPPLTHGMDEGNLSRGISVREERGVIENTGSDPAGVLNHGLHKDINSFKKNLFVGNVQDAQQAYKETLNKKGIRPSLLSDAYAPGIIPGFTDPLSDDKAAVLSSASPGLEMGVLGKKEASVEGTKLSNPLLERLNHSLHDTICGQLDEPITPSSFIGVSKKQGLVNTGKTREIGLVDNRNPITASKISLNTNHLLASDKRMSLAEKRKKLIGMFSNRAIRINELNVDLMESGDFSYEGIDPLLSDDDDPDIIAATRDKPSRLHVDDIITIPTKLTIYMAYQMSTNGTYENTGIHTAASVYVPTAIFAANTALKWLANGAVKNYLQSNAFREIKQVLVFDAQSASGDIRNLLLRYGINNEDQIQEALDVIYGDNFIPGRDMSQLYNSMDLSNVVNPQTGNLFTPAEISDFRHELLTIINSNTPDVEGINPETLMNLKDRKGLLEQQKMINQYLRKHLLTGTRNRGLGNLAGTVSVRQLRKLLKRTDLTAEEIAVIKHALKLHAAIKTSEMSHKKLGITRNIRRHARKLLINTHVGSGAFLLLDLVRMITHTLKYTMRNAAQMGKGIKYGLVLASRPIRSAAFMVNHAIRLNPVINQAMTGYVDPVVNRVRNVVENASDTVKNVHTRRSHLRQRARNFSRETRKFFRDPFRIRERTMSRLAKTKAGKAAKKATAPVKNIANMVRAAIAKVVATIAAVVSTIVSLLSGILIVLLLILLLFVIIYFLIATFMNMFTLNADASDSDTAILNRCIETINSMYENQMSSINSISNGGRYRNVTVNIRQVKDEEEYSNNDSDSEGSDIYAYTNSREILSMAKVYFDFDLDGASETEVLNYVKQLYNGSHTYYVTETPVYAEDDEGNSYIAAYDATIDYTTYYFNAIFNCQLLNDSYGGSAILGSDISGGVVAEQMWNYFKSAGWSDAACAAALGNAAQESGGTLISGINPAAHGSGGRGVFGFTYSPDSKKSDDGMGLVRYAESQGTDWTDLKTQLDYFVLCQQGVWGSMWNSNSQTAKEFRNAGYTVPACSFEQFTQLQDVDQATMVFLCAYENCGIRNARWETRSREANKAYSLYAGTTAESSPEGS